MFAWIKACGNAGRVVNWRSVTIKSFSEQAQVLVAAENLGVKALPRILREHLQRRAGRLVHPGCINQIFASLRKPHHFLKVMVAESTAEGIFEAEAVFFKRCNAEKEYFNLCKIHPEFRALLKEYLTKIEQEWRHTPAGQDWVTATKGNPLTVWEWKESRFLGRPSNGN